MLRLAPPAECDPLALQASPLLALSAFSTEPRVIQAKLRDCGLLEGGHSGRSDTVQEGSVLVQSPAFLAQL